MKKVVFWLVAIVIGLVAVTWVMWQQMEYANRRLGTAEANVKAYSEQLSDSRNRNSALQLTVGQLSYFGDSVLKALDATRKELKIKDKNLKALQSVSSSFSRKDTITLTDTLFREPDFRMDTIIGDAWYSLRLGLEYPSVIAVEPEFKSQKYIVVSTKKETVNPPKKFFLFRWFQKKMTVVHIDVVEKNPYVNGESSKYVEILK